MVAKKATAGAKTALPKITRGRWGGLETLLVSGVTDDEESPTLVLLHGFGGRPTGPRLLHAAKVTAIQGRMRVFIPRGQESHGDGRAWWGGDGNFWPAHASGSEQGDDVVTPGPVARARTAVLNVLRAVKGAFGSHRPFLAGYSQGAMLAVDVALNRDSGVDRVAILSGRLLSASLPALRAVNPQRARAFIAHGRSDAVVPFVAGKLLRSLLVQHGHDVVWRPFRGGHRLPPASLIHEMVEFLKPHR
jgi:phospholipase/carboxylesterase